MPADRVERFLDKLERAETEHAVNALRHPAEHTPFEYGRVCGVSQGLALAKQILGSIMKEEEDDIKRREARR